MAGLRPGVRSAGGPPLAIHAAGGRRRVVRVRALTNCGGFEFPALQSCRQYPLVLQASYLRDGRCGEACAVLRNEFARGKHLRKKFSGMIHCHCPQMAACVALIAVRANRIPHTLAWARLAEQGQHRDQCPLLPLARKRRVRTSCFSQSLRLSKLMAKAGTIFVRGPPAKAGG